MVVLEHTGVQKRGSADTKNQGTPGCRKSASRLPPGQHRGLVKRFKITKMEGIRDKRNVDGGGAKTQLEPKGHKRKPTRPRESKTLDSLSQKGPNFQLAKEIKHLSTELMHNSARYANEGSNISDSR